MHPRPRRRAVVHPEVGAARAEYRVQAPVGEPRRDARLEGQGRLQELALQRPALGVVVPRVFAGHLEPIGGEVAPVVVERGREHVAVGHLDLVAHHRLVEQLLVEQLEVVAGLQFGVEVDLAREHLGHRHREPDAPAPGVHRGRQRVVLAVDRAPHGDLVALLLVVDEGRLEAGLGVGAADDLQVLVVVHVVLEPAEPVVAVVDELVGVVDLQVARIEDRAHRLDERVGRIAQVVRGQQRRERGVADHLVLDNPDVGHEMDIGAGGVLGQGRFDVSAAASRENDQESERRHQSQLFSHAPTRLACTMHGNSRRRRGLCHRRPDRSLHHTVSAPPPGNFRVTPSRQGATSSLGSRPSDHQAGCSGVLSWPHARRTGCFGAWAS